MLENPREQSPSFHQTAKCSQSFFMLAPLEVVRVLSTPGWRIWRALPCEFGRAFLSWQLLQPLVTRPPFCSVATDSYNLNTHTHTHKPPPPPPPPAPAPATTTTTKITPPLRVSTSSNYTGFLGTDNSTVTRSTPSWTRSLAEALKGSASRSCAHSLHECLEVGYPQKPLVKPYNK